MSSNPFDIDPKRAQDSPKRNRYSTVWSQSEQDSKLVGYLEIPPELWPTIKCGSHIRYISKDNEFRTGGFIIKNPYNYHDETDPLIKPNIEISTITNVTGERIGMRLQNSFNNKSPNYATWVIAYEDIKKIYLKVDASIRTIVQSLDNTIENINTNLKKITEYIKKMDDRIKKLEKK